jgi:hypothetical protein
MAKKKPTAQAKPAPLLTGAAARERVVRAAYVAWDTAHADAQKAYDQATHGAWGRYITALKAHGNGKLL